MALAQGDGFVEKKTEPASIDKLLAISTFDPPPPTTATETAVASDLSHTTHDVDIPLNRKVLSYIELFQGQPAGVHQRRAAARRAIPADDSERVP